MDVLGIDVGLGQAPSAIALVRYHGSAPTLLHHHSYTVNEAWSWERRLQFLGRAVLEAISSLRPGLVAWEGSHYAVHRRTKVVGGEEVTQTFTNPQSFRKLAAMEGAILLACDIADVPCICVQPVEAKIALTGDRFAKKPAMKSAARIIFGLKLSEHEADACGISMAGERKYQQERLLAAAAGA